MGTPYEERSIKNPLESAQALFNLFAIDMIEKYKVLINVTLDFRNQSRRSVTQDIEKDGEGGEGTKQSLGELEEFNMRFFFGRHVARRKTQLDSHSGATNEEIHGHHGPRPGLLASGGLLFRSRLCEGLLQVASLSA